ncbi:MAG: TRZ/ATZ family hydrolase [endosymbiont of Galathealinum brachiosum]|uniref:5-methylthioadenosine/S-adenosylhomocysteine deaminase n=1 Tax=endosymbiont of Galathealinum brachiosum TaxID=2200906 RepID=A0A370D8P0_9GAMM|nr:MAG: TRZ/ATZ family hydrolase [endosymbiont of Galathealinum brachiosum]
MKSVDTILHARWILPVTESDPLLHDHCIIIDDGRITDILPSSESTNLYTAQIEKTYNQHLLMPGLINAHTHSPMSLFRGIADDLPLEDWLNNHIWPAEAKWVSDEFVHDGTQLAIAEMIRSGTTCFNDMYFFPEVTARLARDIGIRACIGLIAVEFPSAWASNADEYIDKGLELRDHFRSDSLIHTPFAPHAPFTVSDAPLSRIRVLADEMDLPIHIHVHETADEIEQSIKQHGKRPLERLNELGLVSPNLMAVHLTQVTDEEITLLAESSSHVVHCPESNLKLASGFCPVKKLMDAGINVALGTDGSASNNDLNMLGEMHTASLLAKGVSGDATALTAMQTIRMATINGAKALGLDQDTGSLEAGKYADITAIDFSALEMNPIYDPVANLVYSAGREQVTDVWVAGRHLLKDKELTTLDEQDIMNKCRKWNEVISTFENEE